MIWKPIMGYEAYQISDEGDIRVRDGSKHYGSNSTRYKQIKLYNHLGNKKQYSIHLLVAITFIGPKPSPNHQVNHIDGRSWVKYSNQKIAS